MPSIRHKRKTFAIVLAAVLVIAAFGAGLHLVEKHFQGKESGPGDNGGRGNPTNQEHRIKIDYDTYVYTDDIETYLLFGTDDDGTARKGKKGFNGAMADAIALLIVNNTSEKYAFIQIDRNTMTDVPILDENGEPNGTANEQLCIAHWYGQNEEQRNRNMVNTVSYVLGGLDIDGYFALDMRALGKLTHAIGGVAVDIETDMTKIDPEFKTPASDNMVYQNFPAIVFGFPMMLLATMAPVRPWLTLIILTLFFIVMNVILFRNVLIRMIRKKAKDNSSGTI